MRLLLFYLVLVIAQGFLAALMNPFPTPDLFMLAVLILLWRIQPWQLVLLAYGVGLLQDLMGAGVLGVHAFALAAAALAASIVRAQLTQSGVFERGLVILSAEAGKWLAMVPLLLWLTGSSESLVRMGAVAAVESVLTVAAGLLLLPWGAALLQRSRLLRKELL
jgi:rod shape-determining protein MreD